MQNTTHFVFRHIIQPNIGLIKLLFLPEKPLAIVADIDETVLNNLPYNEMLIETGESLKNLSVWVNKKEATAIPGALDFSSTQKTKVLKSFTFQIEEWKTISTKANLILLSLLMIKPLCYSEIKTEIKNQDESSSSYNILMLLGDNLSDFNERFYKESNEIESKGLIRFKNVWRSIYPISKPNLWYLGVCLKRSKIFQNKYSQSHS